MASMMSPHGVVLATAMAVSGTMILLTLRLQKSFLATHFPVNEIPHSSPPIVRSCISSVGKKKEKKKKRVHFADDVVVSSKDGEEFRRKLRNTRNSSHSKVQNDHPDGGAALRGMPENRVALYNGILRDRVAQRLAYSY